MGSQGPITKEAGLLLSTKHLYRFVRQFNFGRILKYITS